jgi:hypothetical protein
MHLKPLLSTIQELFKAKNFIKVDTGISRASRTYYDVFKEDVYDLNGRFIPRIMTP